MQPKTLLIHGSNSLVGSAVVARLLSASHAVQLGLDAPDGPAHYPNSWQAYLTTGQNLESTPLSDISQVSTPLPDAILFCSVELGSIETTAEEEEAALDRAVNCFRVIPAEIESDIEENERLLVIKLHDLYAPGGAGGWGPPEMEQWIAGLIGDDTDLDDSHPTRFWVHLRDAVSAICALLESPNFDSGVIDLCGRRAWSAPAVLQELSLLWHRFEVTRDRTTTVTDLARAPAFMQSSPREEVERPALEGLHSRLVAADGGGWHPLTQFRTGLMECLALANDQ